MAEFTFRNIVQRALSYDEVDDNFRRVQELHDATLEARDVSLAQSIIYPDTTAGLAATAEGGYFVVPDTSTDELVFYREEAGIAAEKVRIGARASFAGGTLITALNEAPPVTLASAATTDIGGAPANTVIVSGTATITALGAAPTGAIRHVRATGAFTLTHHATSLILPGGANIVATAGEVFRFESLGSGNWRLSGWQQQTAATEWRALKTSDQLNIGASYADVTGTGLAVAANTTYAFEFHIIADADATSTGIDVACNGPAGATAIHYTQTKVSSLSGTELIEVPANAYDNNTAATVSLGTTKTIYRVKGVLINGATAGTLIARAKREAVGSGPNVRAGSYGILKRLS